MLQKTRIRRAGIIAASAALLLGTALPANAAGKDLSCQAGGFGGILHMTSTRSNTYLQYRISKGSQSGGNHAYVSVVDNGTMPRTEVWTYSGKQDNVIHTLYGPYNRGGGTVSVNFVFDKSGSGSDPHCLATANV